MKLKLLVTLFSVLVLGACSSGPQFVIVSPDFMNNPVSNVRYYNKNIELTVQDFRPSQHLLQINKKDRASELYPSQDSLAQLILTDLSKQYKKQGLSINSLSINKLELTIEKALITVEQGVTQYQARNEIIIQAKINNGEQTLTKTFQISGSSKGPFDADFAVLGRDFNQQLSKLLSQLLIDAEIRGAIK